MASEVAELRRHGHAVLLLRAGWCRLLMIAPVRCWERLQVNKQERAMVILALEQGRAMHVVVRKWRRLALQAPSCRA